MEYGGNGFGFADYAVAGAYGAATPATGNYAEQGYVYFFNAITKEVWIVFSPKTGATKTKISAGTAAYVAILNAITSGAAAPISSEQLKAMRHPSALVSAISAAAKPSVKAMREKSAAVEAALPGMMPGVEAAPTGITSKKWFWPVVAGGTLLLVGGYAFLMLRPRN